MKYLKKYGFKRFIEVAQIISLYGEEDAAIFLNAILENKFVKVINGILTLRNESEQKEGDVQKIFYIDYSGFMILRFVNDNDIIINNASLQTYEDLNYELGELAINSKKYNL